MKKMLSLLLALSTLLTLSACSSAKFEESYIQTYDKIASLHKYSSATASTVSEIWNAAGPDYTVGVLSYMLSAGPDYRTSWNGRYANTLEAVGERYSNYTIEDEYEKVLCEVYGWEYDFRYGIDYEDGDACIDTCLEYQNNYNQTLALNEELNNEIKELRSEYGKKYNEEFELLNTYYVEVSTYADLALEPSGNLLNYRSNISSLEQSIPKLAKAAEIY